MSVFSEMGNLRHEGSLEITPVITMGHDSNSLDFSRYSKEKADLLLIILKQMFKKIMSTVITDGFRILMLW